MRHMIWDVCNKNVSTVSILSFWQVPFLKFYLDNKQNLKYIKYDTSSMYKTGAKPTGQPQTIILKFNFVWPQANPDMFKIICDVIKQNESELKIQFYILL